MSQSQTSQAGVYPPGSFKARLVEMVPPSVSPNHITLFRLACTAGIVVVQLVGGHLAWMFVLGFVAGMSDLLDGMVARQRGQITPLGAFLDPLGDKLLAIAVAVVLMLRGFLAPVALIAILAVDAHALLVPLLHIARQLLRRQPIWPAPRVRPNRWGKYKTFGLASSLGIIVLGAILGLPVLVWAGQWLVWTAVALGAAASLRYYWDWTQGAFD
ncbi:MAG: CDP-alcohol phosphatidyltransferase family protein [Desulfarculus sp.]|nr:MAG: CDP-alcohol phosphatidyltransferase family protein [Desulfarculus sp.]